MELTHYERYVESFDQKAKAIAQKILDSKSPPHALADYMERTVAELVENPQRIGQLSEPTGVCFYVTTGIMQQQENPFSYEALTRSEHYAAVLAVSRRSTNHANLVTAGQMHFHLSAHMLAGTKVYLPSEGLGEQLYYTELKGLTVENLKLPYKAIYIIVPKTVNLQIWNDLSEWHRVIGMYVVEDTRKGSRSWRFLVCGERKPLQSPIGMYTDNDALVYFSVALPEGMSLDKAIATAQEGVVEDMKNMPSKLKEAFVPNEDKWKDLFQWAMNVVVYATSDEAEWEHFVANKEGRQLVDRVKKLPSKSKKRKKLQEQLNRIYLRRRILLGKSEERLFKPAKRRGGWTLDYEVVVKGHTKEQAYGPQWSYRRTIRIRPYTKGPEGVPKPESESVAEAEKARSPSPN